MHRHYKLVLTEILPDGEERFRSIKMIGVPQASHEEIIAAVELHASDAIKQILK